MRGRFDASHRNTRVCMDLRRSRAYPFPMQARRGHRPVWLRALLACVICHALVLRLGFAFAMDPVGDGPASAGSHVFCFGAGSTHPGPLPDPLGGGAPHCADCCLSAWRIVPEVPPTVAVPARMGLVLYVLSRFRSGFTSRAPPFEAWSAIRAQRAPPSLQMA
jgi:hypothetical protein